ncbi:zinc finger protein 862-like [Ptychodera flava]|uniref:zinc finger protein 862-like n=1 Tax=Ptychodera flava TaxID=63121 RepID=UPI00396A1876
MIDESTDVSVISTLMVYIRYVDSSGHVRSHFLSVEQLPGCDSEAIYGTVINCLLAKGLDPNVIALATDGASVMVGTKTGVAAKFKENMNPYMLSNHCLAHRLALASGNAADNVKYLLKFQEIVNAVFKFFHYSPKNLRNLNSIRETLQESRSVTLKQTFHTRWLSFHKSVASIISCLDSLLTCFQSLAATNVKAAGFVKQMACFKFLATAYFLKDALEILSKLCESLQKPNLIFAQVQQKLNSYIVALQGLKTNAGSGTAFQEFLRQLPSVNAPESGFSSFMSHQIKDTEHERKLFEATREEFIDKVILNISNRFPDSDLMVSFAIFEPSFMPDRVKQDH